ncbi:arginine--tRNA ligase [Aerococcus kribbianus]|uniref:Arginine--tRNA ligase n=1 Tax=Aerococcus kribbianus TaxID=2999064 RepID=A0A9X3JFE3_9LACT|nr:MULTISPECIES: arginine--tRNA ligase [unclassified Aerococcus]MCZ0716992.1 arginine--tRNA ligase [Aerococcus sp. YH-aer221]MCZ0725280.1 arginine--tRNA ligase [Aerococcus sp. YH-aer222]
MDLKQLVANAIESSTDLDLSYDEIKDLLEVPRHEGHGDIAFPCFVLAKQLRKSPQDIAKDLAQDISGEGIAEVEAAGPYINFKLDHELVSQNILKEIYAQGKDYGTLNIGKGENVTIDMSSPNIAKPMSMGHLRSTVIGNAIANIEKKVGFNPIRINHLGDWGTQFGKLIVAYKNWGNEEDVRRDPIAELLKYYVQFHEEAEEDDSLNDQGRLWFKKLEDGDPEAVELWTWFKDESLKEFNRIYDKLGVEFDYYTGEAFYNDRLQGIVDELVDKGLLEKNQGASIVNLDEFDLNPALILKSDGASLYITRDLATAEYRKETFDFAESIYVVGNEQSYHFKQLKAVLARMGHDWQEDMHHVPFGLITAGGKKLSTRKGNVILLEDVLNDAVDLAKEQIESKNPDLANKEEVAHQVGVGAVVFHDLKNDRLNSFDFVLEEVVQFEGETGPYVQYANARANSLLRKAGFDESKVATQHEFALADEDAFAVVKELNLFPSIVEKAYYGYEPSVIAKYVIGLAQSFNRYYANTRILNDDDQLNARLSLVFAVTQVLEAGLNLLGVQAPKEM